MRWGWAACVAVLAALAAGCGGGGSDESATEQWANGVCSALQTWSDTVQTSTSALKDPASLSVDSLTATLNDVISATKTLATDIKDLGPPDTEAGDQAQQTLTDLASTLEDDASTLQGVVDEGASSGVSGLLEQVSKVTATLGSMASAVGKAFDELESSDAKGELEDAFTNAKSCDALANSSGS